MRFVGIVIVEVFRKLTQKLDKRKFSLKKFINSFSPSFLSFQGCLQLHHIDSMFQNSWPLPRSASSLHGITGRCCGTRNGARRRCRRVSTSVQRWQIFWPLTFRMVINVVVFVFLLGHRWNCTQVWKKDVFGHVIVVGEFSLILSQFKQVILVEASWFGFRFDK